MTHPKSLQDWLDLDSKHIWHPYAPINNPAPSLLVDSAEKCRLHLASGDVLIDGMSSWWSAIHGYNHPVLNDAMQDQAQKMSHVMFGGLTHKPAIRLGNTLIAMTPKGLNHVFFSDSGSVAVEVAIKMAVQYWLSQDNYEKHKFLSFHNSYHGDTFAAMSLCDPINGMHHLFQHVLTKHLFSPAPPKGIETPLTETVKQQLREMFSRHHSTLAGVIIEPIVQGAGGMRIYSKHFLNYLKELCVEFDVLLICDEIATGFARSGQLFGCNHSKISPDIMCLGKAITGGYLSFAATLCTSRVAEKIDEGKAKVLMHGPTFMANPLACSLANASIDLLLQSNWEQNISRIENGLLEGLNELKSCPWVCDVRCLGAIGVVELEKPVDMQKITRQFVQKGIWLRPFGKLVYTMPPYIISEQELNALTRAMAQIISKGDIF